MTVTTAAGQVVSNDTLLAIGAPRTNFTLMPPPAASDIHANGLVDQTLILWTMSALSIICCLIMLGTYFRWPQYSKMDANRVVTFMAAADLLFAVSLVIVPPPQANLRIPTLQLLQAFTVQWSTLSAAMWSLSQSISLLMILCRSKRSTPANEKWFYGASYGMPFAIAFTLLLIPNIYNTGPPGATEPFTWIQGHKWLQIGVMYAPLALILLANVILYTASGFMVQQRTQANSVITSYVGPRASAFDDSSVDEQTSDAQRGGWWSRGSSVESLSMSRHRLWSYATNRVSHALSQSSSASQSSAGHLRWRFIKRVTAFVLYYVLAHTVPWVLYYLGWWPQLTTALFGLRGVITFLVYYTLAVRTTLKVRQQQPLQAGRSFASSSSVNP